MNTSNKFYNQVFNANAIQEMKLLPNNSIDLIIADPPYNLGKDYGNDSDKQESNQFLNWTKQWLQLVIDKLKPNGSLYIFTTWREEMVILCLRGIFLMN